MRSLAPDGSDEWLRPPPQRSPEEGVRFAVFGVAILEPSREFVLVRFALVAAVAFGVITQIKQPAGLLGLIRRGTVGSKSAEHGDVAWREFEHDPLGHVDRV